MGLRVSPPHPHPTVLPAAGPGVPAEASLGAGGIWGGGGPRVTLMLGDGKPEPLALVLELQPSSNWKSWFL